MFILGIQVDNDKLNWRIENWHSPVYSFLYLSIFVKDISTTIQDRKFIFGIENNNYKLYRGIEKRLCPICSFLYLLSFLSLHAIITVIFRKRFLSNCSIYIYIYIYIY